MAYEMTPGLTVVLGALLGVLVMVAASLPHKPNKRPPDNNKEGK